LAVLLRVRPAYRHDHRGVEFDEIVLAAIRRHFPELKVLNGLEFLVYNPLMMRSAIGTSTIRTLRRFYRQGGDDREQEYYAAFGYALGYPKLPRGGGRPESRMVFTLDVTVASLTNGREGRLQIPLFGYGYNHSNNSHQRHNQNIRTKLQRLVNQTLLLHNGVVVRVNNVLVS
jgi:hypothetical protein